jgi:hypothetical protein
MTYEEHGDANDTSREEGYSVRRHPQTTENLWGVVENRVYAGPLLEKHGYCCDNNTAEHWFRFEQRTDGHELPVNSSASGSFPILSNCNTYSLIVFQAVNSAK